MASMRLRILLDSGRRIGPGKIELLEQIAACGSISGAGRKLAMSYRRAWELVDEMNGMFAAPLVERQVGGARGGGATLTDHGRSVVTRYRAIERDVAAITRDRLDALQSEAAPSDSDRAGGDQAGLRSIG